MSKRVSFGSATRPPAAPQAGTAEALAAFVERGRTDQDETPVAPRAKATQEERNIRLNFVIEEKLRHRFKLACTAQNRTIQDVMTELVEDWTAKHG